MTNESYSRFLPEPWRSVAAGVDGESTWWRWPASTGRPSGSTDVHVLRATRPSAPLRVLLLHGGGGHSGLVWPLGAILANEGYEVLAPDLPLYGRTRVAEPGRVRYQDWVDLVADLITAETADDPRPLVVFGASLGGMLAYEVAAGSDRVAAVVATCLLDLAGDPAARRSAARTPALARGIPVMSAAARIGVLARLRFPIRWVAPMSRMSLDPVLAKACIDDELGAGSVIPLGFLTDLMTHEVPAPEEYAGPRVVLVHPAADTWTPPGVSVRFARRIAAPTDIQLLTGCGHFPMEQPGIDELAGHLRGLADDIVTARRT
ncbi:alpha/beta fold hydrolase [Gordonia sp. zg691]|uniref:Alpha/beta fold hydrolase n=1 Tax=Gordonia jinghuaiqii TaxID=2758710 RepID=A0A7D7LQM9_9ACTN|nr:alpha/beta fold hydrolase [Gordonia jinghuaiqii]MBD0863391.1 alpha/beta fold hydrolase [Gordonia jinghuaiqii]MCR5979123.1 alpha/beta fold hydrolase [Gordonia jinghuaiqii]QMT00925.1 alpha/beta fold hydrolase [Gordonia jinghuaiqii]